MLDNNSDDTEARDVTASAVLHIDESADFGTLPKGKPKKKRPESRNYPTGKKGKDSIAWNGLQII